MKTKVFGVDLPMPMAAKFKKLIQLELVFHSIIILTSIFYDFYRPISFLVSPQEHSIFILEEFVVNLEKNIHYINSITYASLIFSVFINHR